MANVSSSNGLEKYPKLRFKGFSEPWETVRIGEIYAERSERGAEDMELLSVTMNDGVKMRSDIERGLKELLFAVAKTREL